MKEHIANRLKQLITENKPYAQARAILSQEYPYEPLLNLSEFKVAEEDLLEAMVKQDVETVNNRQSEEPLLLLTQNQAQFLVEVAAYMEKKQQDFFTIPGLQESLPDKTRNDIYSLLQVLKSRDVVVDLQKRIEGTQIKKFSLAKEVTDELLPDIIIRSQGGETPAVGASKSGVYNRKKNPVDRTTKHAASELAEVFDVLEDTPVEVHFDGSSFSLKAPGISINIENIGRLNDTI